MFGRDKDKMDVIETLPMVPLRDVVVFPHMMIPFVIGRPSSIRALEYALVKGKRIFLSAQHDATRDNPGPDEIYTLGTICNIVQSLKLTDGNVKVLVEGLERGVPSSSRRRTASSKWWPSSSPGWRRPAGGSKP
jgi:ATP-dependent Lon protease